MAFGLVKAVSSVAVGAASSLFTFGGSLATGGVAMSGGWASGVGGMLNSLGLGGTTLGGMLGGAVQYAVKGALGGAVTGLLTDGKVGKGMLHGAMSAGIGGALTDAMGGGAAPASAGAAASKADAWKSGTVPGIPGPGAAGRQSAAAFGGAPAGYAPGGPGGTGGAGNASWLGPVLKNVGTALVQGQNAKDSRKNATFSMPQVWYPKKASQKAAAETAPAPVEPKTATA